jgi:hypothetical protein
MVTSCIANNTITKIICAETDCGKSLNDLDIKRMGLSQEIIEKYEKFSFNAAIEAMDDIGWCP